jgi:outer membrane protein TolC
MPLELIRRRPDVQRDYSFLMAADRDMAQAVRNRFPRLSLNLAAQARSNNYSELFNSWAYTLGANLVAPLLYWGRLRAEVDRSEAVKKQQLYQYGQTVLTAFQEVENALISEERQRKQIKILRKRLEMAQQTNKQLRTEFIYGFSQYLDVLLSQDQEQQLQRNLLEAIQEQYEIRISLYRALAGDFQYLPPERDENEKPNP